MRHLLALSALLLLLAGNNSHASNISTGKQLPPLQITELGECVVAGDETRFDPWQSNQLLGKVQVIEYLAARAGIDKLQQPLYAAIKAAGLPAERFAVAKLVNSDDALFGTSGMVAPEVRKSKRQHPDETVVVDANGIGLKSWGLQPKNSAVAIIDASGTVLFFKEGALTGDEIDLAVSLLEQQLQ